MLKKTAILLLAAFIISGVGSSAAEFTVRGSAVVQGRSPKKEAPVQETFFTFTISVKDWLWRLHGSCVGIKDDHQPIPPNIKGVSFQPHPLSNYNIDAGTDGTNIYSVRSWADESSSSSNPVIMAVAEIGKGPVPHIVGASIVSVLWYAFASQCYLDSLTTNQVELPVEPTIGNMFDFDTLCIAEWTRNPGFPHLPEEIYFKHTGTTKEWAQDFYALFKEPTLRPLPAPFNNGFTQSRYQATRFLKTQGLSVPRQCEYSIFAPLLTKGTEPSPKGENLFVVRDFQLKVESAEMRTEWENFVPEPPQTRFRVRDSRFLHGHPPVFGLTYDATNSWPSEEQVRTKREFKGQLVISKKIVGAGSNRVIDFTRFVVIGVALITVVPLLFLLKRAHSKKG